MSVTSVQLFSLPVTDSDRSRDFYVDVLGLELVRETEMGPGMRWVQVRPRGGATSITLVTWFESMPAGSVRGTVLETDDLDADAERLAGLGVALPGGVREAPWGRWVELTDPDGNGIVLQATADTAGA